jgi:hypothetical protein
VEEEWVGFIYFDPYTVDKLATKHNLAPWQVKQAVSCGAHDFAGWDNDSVYGLRLLLTGSPADGKPLIAYLRPLDRTDGTWECLTAWRI